MVINKMDSFHHVSTYQCSDTPCIEERKINLINMRKGVDSWIHFVKLKGCRGVEQPGSSLGS
jgi:hypothetical protein